MLVTNTIQFIFRRKMASRFKKKKLLPIIMISLSLEALWEKIFIFCTSVQPEETECTDTPSGQDYIHFREFRITEAIAHLLSAPFTTTERNTLFYKVGKYGSLKTLQKKIEKPEKLRPSKHSLVSGFIPGTDKPQAAPCSQLEENTQFSPYCVTKKL